MPGGRELVKGWRDRVERLGAARPLEGASAMCQSTPDGSKTKPTFSFHGCTAGGAAA